MEIFEDISHTLVALGIKNVCLLLGVLLASYFVLRRNPRLKYYMNKFPSPTHFPIVGAIPHVMFLSHTEYLEFIRKCEEKYGQIGCLWLGNILPYVYTTNPNIIEKLLNNTQYANKGKHEYSMVESWLGTGLLTAPRHKWAGRRKLLTPAFHFKILEDFIPILNEQASILVNCLKKEADNGKCFNICPYISNCTLDVICETAMGVKINAQTSKTNKEYIEAVDGICSVYMDKVMRPWLRLSIFSWISPICRAEGKYIRILKGFTEKIIQAKLLERKQNLINKNTLESNIEKKRKAFLDLLLDASANGTVLTDADIREEVDTFMFAGHDTTGVNISWTMILLASKPECQEKVHQELDRIFEGDATRDVTSSDLSQMKYLDCCIKEALRLYPSVPYITRYINKDLPLDDGRIIPEGATTVIGIYNLHRNPKYFPQPEKYRPERFLDSSTERHPYTYIPFSAGSRNCIGQKFANMESKIGLAKLLRKYRVGMNLDKLEDINLIPDVVLRAENGINVSLFSRI